MLYINYNLYQMFKMALEIHTPDSKTMHLGTGCTLNFEG